MAQSALIAALLAGLAGGLHCLAMCGGYVGALSTSVPKSAPIVPANLLAIRQLVTHSGRLSAYVALGATFGAAGGAALAADWAPWLRALYVAANVLLLVLGIAVARGALPFAVLEGVGLRLYRAVLPAARPLVSRSSTASRFALGALWGLTPCGLVYGVLPVAMLSGSALDGALVMLLFGVGTLPNLVAAGLFAQRAQRLLSNTKARYVAGALIGIFGIVGIYRALFIPGALAHGPFCIVP